MLLQKMWSLPFMSQQKIIVHIQVKHVFFEWSQDYQMPEAKYAAWKKWLACPNDHNYCTLKNLHKTLQLDPRATQNHWWRNLAAKMQEDADKHDGKNFFTVLCGV